MEPGYRIPKIVEIIPGFQYQYLNHNNEWVDETFDPPRFHDYVGTDIGVYHDIFMWVWNATKKNRIRIKMLEAQPMKTINDLPLMIKKQEVKTTQQLQNLLKEQALFFRYNKLRIIVFPKQPYEAEEYKWNKEKKTYEETGKLKTYYNEHRVYINEREQRSLEDISGSAGYYYRKWFNKSDEKFTHDWRWLLELNWPILTPTNYVINFFQGIYTGTKGDLESIQANRIIPESKKDNQRKANHDKNREQKSIRKVEAYIKSSKANPKLLKKNQVIEKETKPSVVYKRSVKEFKYWERYNELYDKHKKLAEDNCHMIFVLALKRDVLVKEIAQVTKEIKVHKKEHPKDYKERKPFIKKRQKCSTHLNRIVQWIEYINAPIIKAWTDFNKYRAICKHPSYRKKSAKLTKIKRENRQKLAKIKRHIIIVNADTQNGNKQFLNQMVCIESQLTKRIYRVPRYKADKYCTKWFKHVRKFMWKMQLRNEREEHKTIAENYYKERKKEYEGKSPLENRKQYRTKLGLSKPYGISGSMYKTTQKVKIEEPEEIIEWKWKKPLYIRKPSWRIKWKKDPNNETLWDNMRIKDCIEWMVKLEPKRVIVGFEEVVVKVKRKAKTRYKTISRTVLSTKAQKRITKMKERWKVLQEAVKKAEEENKKKKEEGKE